MKPNHWLLILKGKDGMFSVHTFSSRRAAVKLADSYRTKNVLAMVLDIDELISQQGEGL